MNSSLNYLTWKGYILLCVTMQSGLYIVSQLRPSPSISRVRCLVLLTLRSHLLNIGVFFWFCIPNTAVIQCDSGGGSLCITPRPVRYPSIQWQQLNRDRRRGHIELLSWLLISSPMLCTVVLCGQNPSILLLFGLLMLADGNPAQLSKMLNNLLRTKLLSLRAGSFSFSPFFFPLQTDFQRQSF